MMKLSVSAILMWLEEIRRTRLRWREGKILMPIRDNPKNEPSELQLNNNLPSASILTAEYRNSDSILVDLFQSLSLAIVTKIRALQVLLKHSGTYGPGQRPDFPTFEDVLQLFEKKSRARDDCRSLREVAAVNLFSTVACLSPDGDRRRSLIDWFADRVRHPRSKGER